MVVGAFFVLSGYVTAMSTMEHGRQQLSARFRTTSSLEYTKRRILALYPAYAVVQIFFLPVFMFADVTYNGWVQTLQHAAITFSLSQAWFPKHAELWNPPTWFMSSIAYSAVILPTILPVLAKLGRKSLLQLLGVALVASVAINVMYCQQLSCWQIPNVEGLNKRNHPNTLLFNTVRFSPFCGLLETIVGVCAARLVMLSETKEHKIMRGDTEVLWHIAVLAAPAVLISVFVVRALEWVAVNDLLIRSVVFVPAFALFLASLHKMALYRHFDEAEVFATPESVWLIRWLESPALVQLGQHSLMIFLVHGPIGQIFYKKVVAKKLFGFVFGEHPWFFLVYLLLVMGSAATFGSFLCAVQGKKSNSSGISMSTRLTIYFAASITLGAMLFL